MLSNKQKQQRADRARANGAKSKGAITPEGQLRARTATLEHGLYAAEETLRHTIDPVRLQQLHDEYHALWAPENRYIADKVNDLVSFRWKLDRLVAVQRHHLSAIFMEAGSLLDGERLNSETNNVAVRLETRIRQHHAAISRLERDILRLKKFFASVEPSQKSLQTNTNPVTPTPPCLPGPTFDPPLRNHPAPEPEIGGPKVPETSDTALRS